MSLQTKPNLLLHRIHSLFLWTASAVAAMVVPSVHAQEVVAVQHVSRHTVNQVVVSGEGGEVYVMKTLQPITNDRVVVTSAMAHSALPFSVVQDQLVPVQSLREMPSSAASGTGARIAPGVKEVHSVHFNSFYEVVYQQAGRWMVVDMLEAPANGQLTLTRELASASRQL